MKRVKNQARTDINYAVGGADVVSLIRSKNPGDEWTGNTSLGDIGTYC